MCRYVLAAFLTVVPFLVGYAFGFKHGFRVTKKERVEPAGDQ